MLLFWSDLTEEFLEFREDLDFYTLFFELEGDLSCYFVFLAVAWCLASFLCVCVGIELNFWKDKQFCYVFVQSRVNVVWYCCERTF